MAAETQYTPNTGMVTISTGNPQLDGSGALGTVLTGAANGTLVKTVTIKAQNTTTQGMVRLFVYDGTNTKLVLEVEVPAVVRSAASPSFETTVTCNCYLKNGWSLKASTEQNETFNVIAEAQNWAYYATSVRPETTLYTVINGLSIAVPNPNVDGSGSLGNTLQLSSNGANVLSLTIKASVSTTDGMVRFFLTDSTNIKLFMEVPIKATVSLQKVVLNV